MNRIERPGTAADQPTVLIVDDTPGNIDFLRSVLAGSYRIKAATSGRRALEVITQDPPDLVLLDVVMPDMDGYSVCRRIKSDIATAKIPVIFVTSKDEARDEELGFSIGGADYVTKPFEPSVVRARVATHLALYDQTRLLQDLVDERTVQLRHEMEQREQAIARIRYLHEYDSLTGLANRNLLMQRINLALESHAGQVAVVIIDVDRFSSINDALGTQLGDLLLQKIASGLKEAAAGHALIGRIGGDSFAALLTLDSRVVDRLHLITEQLDRLLEAVAQPYSLENERVEVRVSAGVAVHPKDGETAELLLKSADAAMHAAKESTLTPYLFYNADMNSASRELLTLEGELRDAIRDQHIVPWFQPKFDMKSRQLVGAEALARWIRPDGRHISPGTFFPLAEKTGLYKALNHRLVHAVCLQARTWRNQGHRPLKLAVNVSAADFQYPGFVADMLGIVQDTGVDPRAIEIEITEHAVIADPETAAEKIRALAAHGFTTALDDFGVGYSSLSYIRQLPIHTLKIDQSFMGGVGEDERANAVAATILTLSNRLGLISVGEGVEHEHQLRFLTDNGCDLVQGFLFSGAMTAEDFATKLLSQPPSTPTN